MNRVRVLKVIDSAKRCGNRPSSALVSFNNSKELMTSYTGMTGAFQSSQANFSLLSICNRGSVLLLFFHIGTLLLFIRP